jgi:hypothetical protein
MTDAGLKELKGLKKLKYLSLARAQVTDAGINELKAALPGLNVDQSADPWDLDFLKLQRTELPLRGRLELPGWLGWLCSAPVIVALAHALGRLGHRPSTDKWGQRDPWS